MKLIRLTLASAALVAALGACNSARLTAPEGANPPASTHSAPPSAPSADQYLGSGG